MVVNKNNMNIIEAIQAAEGGKLITGGVLKIMNHFLKYIGGGIFHEYQIIDGKAIYRYRKTEFHMQEILTVNWEIVEEANLFPKK